jgi:hypothetical protein
MPVNGAMVIDQLPKPSLCQPAPGVFRNDSGVYLDQNKINEFNNTLRNPGLVTEVEGYKDRYRHDDSGVTRVFDVRQDAVDDFKNFMLGYSLLFANSQSIQPNSPLYIRRTLPDQDLRRPWLYCDEVEMVGAEGAMGFDPGLAALFPAPVDITKPGNPLNTSGFEVAYYDTAGRNFGAVRYACHYRPLEYFTMSDWDVYHPASPLSTNGQKELNRNVKRGRVYATKSLNIPHGTLKFVEGPFNGQMIPESGEVRIVPIPALTFTWIDVPGLPNEDINFCIGTINLDTFDGLRGYPSYPPGTLLCLSPSQPEERRGPTGRKMYTITYHMLYNQNGWNSFPADDGNYYRAEIVKGNSLRVVYVATTFSLLFRATQNQAA